MFPPSLHALLLVPSMLLLMMRRLNGCRVVYAAPCRSHLIPDESHCGSPVPTHSIALNISAVYVGCDPGLCAPFCCSKAGHETFADQAVTRAVCQLAKEVMTNSLCPKGPHRGCVTVAMAAHIAMLVSQAVFCEQFVSKASQNLHKTCSSQSTYTTCMVLQHGKPINCMRRVQPSGHAYYMTTIYHVTITGHSLFELSQTFSALSLITA